MHDIDGTDWIWMTAWMGGMLIVIGVVVFAAVTLALRDRHGGAGDGDRDR